MPNSEGSLERESQFTIRLGSGFLNGVLPAGVVLDGKQVAVLSGVEPMTIPASPGSHSLRLTDGLWGSNTERFTLARGEHVTFECHSSLGRDWHAKTRRFWWASPFVDALLFRPCLTRVPPKP